MPEQEEKSEQKESFTSFEEYIEKADEPVKALYST